MKAAPPAVDVSHARRLMAVAQITDIRLVEARAAYSGPTQPGSEQGLGKLRVDVKTSTRGHLADKAQLEIFVSCVMQARRDKDPKPDVQVKATFRLCYALPQGLDPTQQEITAFSKTNAMLNSWPYWREFVQNTVTRMNLPPLVLPLFRLVPVGKKKSTPGVKPTKTS